MAAGEEDTEPQRRDAQALEARRLAALPRIASGASLSAIARQLGVSRQAVHQWAQEYRRQGADGLRRRLRPGRPPKLTREQLAQLPRMLAHGPKAYGFAAAVWTSQRIADLLWKRFRVRYTPDHIPYLLRGLGWNLKEHQAHPHQRRNWPMNQGGKSRTRLLTASRSRSERIMQAMMGK
ncbi:MAG: helix-turn-helix domain-containing protein [Acidobacteriia bacterium]|nr:helix-turn-helix domain-containing protein [Terriglobia bacterium]